MRSSSFSLRSFAAADVDAGYALSRSVGWGHLLENWELMQKVGRGWLAIGNDGSLQGVAMWWPYGDDFATLGMVIVAPELQGRGLGRVLMNQILEEVGTRSVQLISTVAGQPLYQSLGFQVTGQIVSCNVAPDLQVVPVRTNFNVRSARAKDVPEIYAIDRRAIGVDRRPLIDALLGMSNGIVAERNNNIAGYALVHKWGKGQTIGPIVADDDEAALSLLATATANTQGLRHIDLRSEAAGLLAWLQGVGLQSSTRLNVMHRGARVPLLQGGARVFSLASQGLG